MNIHHKKAFLNKPYHHSDASILTEIKISKDRTHPEMDVACRLRDCNHTTNLAFSASTYPEDLHMLSSELKNNEFKVKTLIKNLKEFEKAMKKANKTFKKIVEKKLKKNKEERLKKKKKAS